MATHKHIKDLTRPAEGAREVYLLAGVAGHVLEFRPLAQRLQSRWHLRGIHYPSHATGEMTCPSIEVLANRMLPALSDAPRDPVFLGYSIGGTIAYEMARRLAEQGQNPTVVMIDSNPRYLKRRPRLHEKMILRLGLGFRRLFWRWPAKIFRKISSLIGYTDDSPSQASRFPDGTPVPDWIRAGDPLMQFYRESWSASGNYVPKKSSVKVVMIRSVSERSKPWMRRLFWPSKDHNWYRVAKVIGVVPVVGDHVSIIESDSLERLTHATDQALAIAFQNHD